MQRKCKDIAAPRKRARVATCISILMKSAIRLGGLPLVVIAALTAQAEDVTARMAAVLRYTGVENPAPPDVARMAELWTKAQQPGLSTEERRLTFRDMYLLTARLQGRDLTARPQTLDGLARYVTTVFEAGGRMDLALPEPRGRPSGNYLHIGSRGNGPTQLLLISDFGTDGRRLYGSFMTRQASAYTMHVVTLPFAGSARPMPWPEKIDNAARFQSPHSPASRRIRSHRSASGGRLQAWQPAALLSDVELNALLAHRSDAGPARQLSRSACVVVHEFCVLKF